MMGKSGRCSKTDRSSASNDDLSVSFFGSGIRAKRMAASMSPFSSQKLSVTTMLEGEAIEKNEGRRVRKEDRRADAG
jgi:hypothetical protein